MLLKSVQFGPKIFSKVIFHLYRSNRIKAMLSPLSQLSPLSIKPPPLFSLCCPTGKTCASSGSLKRCNDDKIESIKYGPCKDLLKKSVEICLQDVRGLSIDPGDSDEDKELIMDYLDFQSC